MTNATYSNMADLIRHWKDQSQSSDTIHRDERLLAFLGERLFSEYQPFPEKAPFWDRLFLWLNQLPHDIYRDEDQQTLFSLVPWLLFAGEQDLIAMYRAAFDGPICRWLIEQEGISLNADGVSESLAKAREQTWFGSIAGMDIGTFCRVNRIFGQSYRPEFRFVSKFCDVVKLRSDLASLKYSRIVAVEDIVGTGKQLLEATDALVQLGLPTLLVPLFLAQEGLQKARELTAAHPHIQCAPLFVLPDNLTLTSTGRSGEPDVLAKTRVLLRRRKKLFGKAKAFGFGGKYGTLVLTYTNCPNNVPPILHKKTQQLPYPLFQRASREG